MTLWFDFLPLLKLAGNNFKLLIFTAEDQCGQWLSGRVHRSPSHRTTTLPLGRFGVNHGNLLLDHPKHNETLQDGVPIMGKFFDEIPSFLFPWIEQQEVFWVASAPLSPEGHVNVSPKGVRGSFHIINANKVWYQDISGSGEFKHVLLPQKGIEFNDFTIARYRDHFTSEGKRENYHLIQRLPRPTKDNKIVRKG